MKPSARGWTTKHADGLGPRGTFSASFANGMDYSVEFTARAIRDLDALYEEVNAIESLAAARWFNRLEKAILGLDHSPRIWPKARESRQAGIPLRQLLFGKKPHNVYCVIFTIDDARRVVRVLTIRHGARDEARPTELR